MNYKEEIRVIISGNQHNEKFTIMLESIPNFVLEEKKGCLTSVMSIFSDRITCVQTSDASQDDDYFDLYYNWLSEEMLARIHAFILGIENVLRTYDNE